MRGGLLYLTQDGLHLLLSACAPVGFGEQHGDLYLRGLVLFTFFAWTCGPGAGIYRTRCIAAHRLESLLKLLDSIIGLALAQQALSGADACQHINRAITHSQLVGIDGFVKLSGLLVDLSKGEVDISIVGICLCCLIILAHNRFVFSLTLAA